MPQGPKRAKGPVAESLTVLLCTLFLFASPFTVWWMGAGLAWYFPYLLWFLSILATALLARQWRRHDV